METEIGTENVDVTDASESIEPTDVVETPESSPGPEDPSVATPATEINPAWIGLRDAIGEDHFETFARPILSEMDQNAHKRITSLNSELKQFEGYKPFVEQGLDSGYVTQAVQIAQMLENEPERLYEFLTQHLGKNVEAESESEEEASVEGDIPPEVQAQLDQLKKFQEAQQQAEQEREFQKQVEEMTAQIEQETKEYIANNPTWTEKDIPELDAIRHQLSRELMDKGMNRIATLDEAAAVLKERYAAYQSRFGTPAPNTLPTSAGGNVGSSKTFDAKSASKKDFEAQIVNDLLSLTQQD